MPLYRFTCRVCAKRESRLMSAKGYSANRDILTCKSCGGRLSRDTTPPSSHVVEALDNGAMPRRLERLSEAERLYKERAEGDPQKQKLTKLV